MKAEQLRKSILQLAIQGKLVPQDPNDEPASVLLERIHAEKQRLIKEGKIKKDKNDSVIFKGDDNRYYEKIGKTLTDITDFIEFDIPDNWVWVRLGTCLEIARGGSPRPIKDYLTDTPNGINWIKIGDTDKGGKYINSTKEKIRPEGVSKSRFVHKGDFLLTNSMSFGRPYILNTDGCIHDGWLVLSDLFEIFDKEYLYYLLSSAFAFLQFCDKVSGAVVKNLNSDKVANSIFPLPPLEEQRRIVHEIEKFEPLIAEYDKLEQQATKLDEEIYDKLKKSILQYAIQGKLVPQDPNDEPASVLLERIRTEKKAKLGKKYVDSYIYKGDDNCYYEKVGTNEPARLDYLPFDIPSSWSWVRLENAIIINPRNDLPDNLGVSFVEMKAISDGHNNHFSATTRPWKEVKSGFTHFQDGDVGFAKITPCFQNRKSVVFSGLQNGYGAGTTELHILRPIQGTILPKYLLCFIKSPYLIEYGKQKFSGTAGQQRFGTDEVKKTLFPLPPLVEQERIVKQVEIILDKLKDED